MAVWDNVFFKTMAADSFMLLIFTTPTLYLYENIYFESSAFT